MKYLEQAGFDHDPSAIVRSVSVAGGHPSKYEIDGFRRILNGHLTTELKQVQPPQSKEKPACNEATLLDYLEPLLSLPFKGNPHIGYFRKDFFSKDTMNATTVRPDLMRYFNMFGFEQAVVIGECKKDEQAVSLDCPEGSKIGVKFNMLTLELDCVPRTGVVQNQDDMGKIMAFAAKVLLELFLLVESDPSMWGKMEFFGIFVHQVFFDYFHGFMEKVGDCVRFSFGRLVKENVEEKCGQFRVQGMNFNMEDAFKEQFRVLKEFVDSLPPDQKDMFERDNMGRLDNLSRLDTIVNKIEGCTQLLLQQWKVNHAYDATCSVGPFTQSAEQEPPSGTRKSLRLRGAHSDASLNAGPEIKTKRPKIDL